MKKELFTTYGKKSWKNIIIRLIICLLFPITLLIKDLAKANPQWIERYYSTGLYPVLSQVWGYIFRVIPISTAELIVYSGIILGIVFLVIISYRLLKKPYPVFRFAKVISGLAVFATVMYFMFYLLWGLNYYRLPLAQELEYDVSPTDKYELQEMFISLVDEINEVRDTLDEDENGVVLYDYTDFEMLAMIPDVYSNAVESYDFLSGNYSKPKMVLASEAMSHAKIVGIFIPFTYEANVNTDAPPVTTFATAAHEAAHQRGYASEDEANYIATLVCGLSDNPYVRYSGLQLALVHTSNALYSADKELYYEVSATYSDGVVRDLIDKREYWDQYEGKVAETATTVNDNYLKSNDQDDGVKSYGRMVDLLMGEFRKSKEQ